MLDFLVYISSTTAERVLEVDSNRIKTDEQRKKAAIMPSVQQLFSLEGETALCTGGTRGIGQAMAIALAEAGADILLVQVSLRRKKKAYRVASISLTSLLLSETNQTSRPNNKSRP